MYCRGYWRINQLPSLRDCYNRYKLGTLVSWAYPSRPNGTGFDSPYGFRSVFCDFVDIADDNELYSEPDCPAQSVALRITQALQFLDS